MIAKRRNIFRFFMAIYVFPYRLSSGQFGSQVQRLPVFLLAAKGLDLLYVTQAQVEIPFKDPATLQTILSAGRKIDELNEFRLARQFMQEGVVTEAGSRISQSFFR